MIVHFQRSLLLVLSGGVTLVPNLRAQEAPGDAAKRLRPYFDYALNHDGDADRGRALFQDQKRLACAQCHSIDGTATKAGPDLYAIGDKFPRRELLRAVLEPSAEIAVGYGTTIVETKSGEMLEGIIKQS